MWFLDLSGLQHYSTRCIKNSNLRKEVGIAIRKQVVSSNQLEIAM